jgi:NAD(P)-dependent dehydrogenase (short-subunit alcohol dehydrogenase family)
MSNRLNDKVALVFGAGSCGPGWSNGKAAAVAYARAGARVAAVDIELERAEETSSLIKDEGGQSLALKANVVIATDVRKVIERTMQEFERIDVLHNNVGIPNVGGRTDLDEAHWDRIIDTNLKSVYLTCEQVLPIMVGQRSGVITNISSGASIQVIAPLVAASATSHTQGLYSIAAYSASKAGLNQFTRALAVIYAAHGIRCNVILPGNIDTPRIRTYRHMVEHCGGEEAMLQARHAKSLTGKMGNAWDIAHAAVFLASDEANYINGVLLPVDGGLSCT